MARIRAEQPLVPSIIDRLLDDDPGVSRETAQSRSQVLREMKHSVRRDLENLLNTRPLCRTWPKEWTELSRSLAAYGVPDFTGANMGSGDVLERFRRTVENVLRTFEPRFKSVHVELLSNSESIDRTLRFRIDALLWCDPAPEPVVFDSSVDPTTGNLAVQEAV